MIPEQRENARLAFKAKNEKRREMPHTSQAKLARIARRACGGAFGRADARDFNFLAEGTSARLR